MTNTVRINFDTSSEIKQKIKVYTSVHNLTIREFFEELLEEKFNSDVQPLTEEEQKEINEAIEFFKDKPKYNFSSKEMDQMVVKVKNGESLINLLGMDCLNDWFF